MQTNLYVYIRLAHGCIRRRTKMEWKMDRDTHRYKLTYKWNWDDPWFPPIIPSPLSVSQGPRLPVEASVWAGPRHWVEGRWPHERLRRLRWLRWPLAAHCGYFQTSVEVGDLGRLVTNSNNGSTVHLEVNKRQKRRENPREPPLRNGPHGLWWATMLVGHVW